MVSLGHWSVHVEPDPQLTPQASTSQVTRHVEPMQLTVLDSPRTITSHVALSRQLTLAERPTVKSHVDATHSGLALSPATISQLAPSVQFALQELLHVAAHEDAVQSRLQLEPSPLQLFTAVHPQVIALEPPAHAHAAPVQLHWDAVQGTGPGAELQAARGASSEETKSTGARRMKTSMRSDLARRVPPHPARGAHARGSLGLLRCARACALRTRCSPRSRRSPRVRTCTELAPHVPLAARVWARHSLETRYDAVAAYVLHRASPIDPPASLA